MNSRKSQRSAALSILTLIFAAVAVLPAGASGVPQPAVAQMPEPEAFATPAATPVPAITFGASTVRLRAATHTLYRFGSLGKLLGTRTVRLLRPKVWGTPAEESSIASGRYVKLTSGPHAGWWVAANAAQAASPATFSPELNVTVREGRLVARRFFGSVVTRRVATLANPTAYLASRRGVFNGVTHYLIANGPLSGRWVAAGRIVVGSSSPLSTPKPSPTTTAQPTPTAQPTAAPETAPRATWKAIVLLYRETDVTFRRADGSDYRLTARMSNNMYNLVRDTLGRYQSSVKSWSGGVVQLDMKIVDMPHPLTKLDVLGSGYWVGPDAVRSDMNTYAPKGTYDSIVVVFQPKDSAGVSIPIGGWGLTIPDGSWSNGAGFSSVITPGEMWWWTDSAAPEEVFVHEWMHQVIFFHERHGRANVDLHAGAQYGYSNADGTWKRWMSDLMQNKVKDGNRLLGISADSWAAGKPSAP